MTSGRVPEFVTAVPLVFCDVGFHAPAEPALSVLEGGRAQ